MTLDIEKELIRIIIKYNLDRYYPRYRKILNYGEKVTELARTLIGKKVVLIFSEGVNGKDDYKRFRWDAPMLCEAIGYSYREIEEKIERQESDFEIILDISPEIYDGEMNNIPMGVNFISLYNRLAYNSEDGIKRYYDLGCEITPQDNEELKLCFPEKKTGKGSKSEYYFSAIRLCIGLKNKIEYEERKKILIQILFFCLYTKDFPTFYEILQDYSTEINEFISIEKIQKDIDDLINRIKCALQKIKEDSVILYWLDALSYVDKTDMPYLQQQIKKGMNFTNAYTVEPQTHPTLQTLFGERDSYGRRVNSIITKENSNVIKELEEEGYKVIFTSGYFDKICEELKSTYPVGLMDSSAMILWNMIRILLSVDNKVFLINHCLIETHFPHYSYLLDEEGIINHSKRYMQGRKALDRILQFYDSLLNDNVRRIYMSDHGQSSWHLKFHTVFSMYDKKMKAGENKDIFSYDEFEYILKRFLRHEDLLKCLPSREYAKIEREDWYSKNFVGLCLKNKEIPLNLIGYKGLINYKELFIKFNTGKTVYKEIRDDLFISDSPEDEIDINVSDDYIKRLEMMAGNDKVNIPIEERPGYSTYVYRVIDNIKQSKKEIYNLLNNIFAGNSRVAIRMGGDHTRHLLESISDDSKKKICCVIDKNKDCLSGIDNLPIININEIEKFAPDVVILSSFKYREMLKEESKALYPQINTVDIYDVLSENGYSCECDFWLEKYRDSDFDVDFPFDSK